MNTDQHTISETMLPVGDGHRLYIQEWGSPKAQPIIFLHGGPGSGCNDSHKDYFDPKLSRVFFLDQRGAGKSLPNGSLKHNNTQKLVADIEVVADRFKLKSFILVGGSWGSTLALAYGLAHPKRVKAMLLRGIFTGSQKEIDFVDKGGFRSFYPDVWEQFVDRTPGPFQHDPGAYHAPRATSKDKKAAKESAYAYAELESSIMQMDDRHAVENFEDFDPAGTIIEISYLRERCFMPDRYILNNAHKLKMPIWLIQGRYDMVCPPETAYQLHRKLPNSHLIWTLNGHRAERETWNVLRTILLQWG